MPIGTERIDWATVLDMTVFCIFSRFCKMSDSVMTTAERIFTASTAEQDILSLFWKCEKLCLAEKHLKKLKKHNSGLLLAIGPDPSTLVFQTNQDNYDEQV